MNMFRKLALASIAAITCCVGNIPAAQAGTCWYIPYGGTATGEYCRTIRRINSNGHIVFDITDGRGQQYTIVLWTDNTAEVFGPDGYSLVNTYDDRDGHTRLMFSDKEFVFVHH